MGGLWSIKKSGPFRSMLDSQLYPATLLASKKDYLLIYCYHSYPHILFLFLWPFTFFIALSFLTSFFTFSHPIMLDEEPPRSAHESEEEDLFGEEPEVGADSALEAEEELKSVDIALPRHAQSHKPDNDTYVIKMPVFLNVEAHPFDPSEFKDQVTQNAAERSLKNMNAKQERSELVAEKLLNENTIRWRYSNAGNDEIVKQANAHFVQWDDGSVLLKVGLELFDFKGLPLYDNFLVKAHDDHEILQNEAILNRQASLLPATSFLATHKKLTEALKTVQKKDKILNTLTENDPMMKQRMADEDERKSLKLRRQLEQRRRLQEERLQKTGLPATRGSSAGYEPAYERFERTYGNEEYDEEDDFIANDDEDDDEEMAEDDDDELDRAAERLQKVKLDGASKYQENLDDEKVARKKRRIIDSDDDE